MSDSAQSGTGSEPLYDLSLHQCHVDLAAAALPGPNYYQVLRWIHELLQPANYVEIGVAKGLSLQRVLDGTVCLGIDPQPMLKGPLHPGTRIFPVTSDDFFGQQDLPSLLGAPHFALAFIDGLHLWEQALRDFINLERYAGPDSVILIHDCLPLDETTSSRTRSTLFFTGDVWKLALCLHEQRPDLRMTVVRTAPAGLCMVANLDTASRVLKDGYDELVNRYTALSFADYQASTQRMPPSIRNDRDVIGAWLAAARATRDHGPR